MTIERFGEPATKDGTTQLRKRVNKNAISKTWWQCTHMVPVDQAETPLVLTRVALAGVGAKLLCKEKAHRPRLLQ